MKKVIETFLTNNRNNFCSSQIGLASSLPYVVSGVVSPVWGYFIDVLRRKKYITTRNVRKLSSFIGKNTKGNCVHVLIFERKETTMKRGRGLAFLSDSKWEDDKKL